MESKGKEFQIARTGIRLLSERRGGQMDAELAWAPLVAWWLGGLDYIPAWCQHISLLCRRIHFYAQSRLQLYYLVSQMKYSNRRHSLSPDVTPDARGQRVRQGHGLVTEVVYVARGAMLAGVEQL